MGQKLINIFLLAFLSVSIYPQNLKSDIDAYLNKHLSGYSKYEYEIINDFKSSGNVIIKDESFHLTNNICYLPCEIKENSKKYTAFLQLRMKLFKMVPIAIVDIKKGDSLTTYSYMEAEAEVTSLRGIPASKEFLEDSKAGVLIPKGTIILEQSLVLKPLIYKNDKVTANFLKGSVLVSFDAIALKDGRTGDLILVENKTKKRFKAKIVDNYNVIIVE